MMKITSRLKPTQSGVAGEYYVAAELSRRGYIASLTLRNTRGIDILVSNANASRSVGIQVKTSQNGPAWLMKKSVEEGALAENLFFVFVIISGDLPPRYYVVPRADVVSFIELNHKTWLSGKKRDGDQRKDTPMRQFKDLDGRYLNRWDLLGLDNE